ncbi:MAG: T9SS type A sorting domain-containing protein [Bacteroidetes bacterium]|nr:T9SS type A sorting domain-containing protein [Bacteroidota bacterium]
MKYSFYFLLFALSSSIFYSQDITAPSLSGFSFSPSSLKITGSNLTVSFSVSAEDDSSGIDKINVSFSSLAGGGEKSAQIKKINSTSATVSDEINFGKNPVLGEWAASVTIIDNDRNEISYSASDLQNIGIDAILSIVSESDETPPELTEFSFSPSAFDLVSGNSEISFAISASDNLSGIDEVSVSFSPSGNGGSKTETIRKINGASNTFSGTIDLGNNPSEGEWYASVSLKDVEGNSITYSTNDLADSGFDNTLTVFSTVDSTPPELTGFSFSPAAIDVSQSQHEIGFSISCIDDISGIDEIVLEFSPEGNGGSKTESYKRINGGYSSITGSMDFGNNPKEGIWHASISLKDVEGNSTIYSALDLETLNYNSTLEIFTTEDITPPVLQSFSFSPDSLDLSGSDLSVLFDLRATDDLSGISKINLSFEPISNGGGEAVRFDKINSTSFQITDIFTFKKSSKEGIWRASIEIEDNEKNKITYTADDLEDLGISSTLFLRTSADITPPVLVDFYFSPDSIFVGENDIIVSYTISATDDLSGIDEINIIFNPEENGGNQSLKIKKIDTINFSQSGEIEFNRNSKTGNWFVSLELSDNSKNQIVYSAEELASLGFSSKLIIGSQKYLDLTFPNGGEIIEKNNPMDVEWECEGIDEINIELSLDNGFSWMTIASNINAQRKRYNWSVAVDPSENALVKISEVNNEVLFDVSDSPLRIAYSVTDIDYEEDLALNYRLEQNYPNPFNPSTVINYSLKNEDFVVISVYNSLGEIVNIIVSESKRAGNYSIDFNASHLPSGVYYYSIITKEFKLSRKMLYLK